MAALGLSLGLPFARPSAVASFDPSTLFTATQYGDFARVESGVPASSGGLLTRWSGQRSAGDAGARFDIMPYSSAPSVGANGPNGESCILLASSKYCSGSEDRGGIASIGVPPAYAGDQTYVTGMVHIMRVYIGGAGSSATIAIGPFAVTIAALFYEGANLYYTDVGAFNKYAGPISTTQPIGNGPGWLTIAARAKPDGTVAVYANNGATPVATASGCNDNQLSQWLMSADGASINVPLAGFMHGHINPSDEDFEQAFNWVAGG